MRLNENVFYNAAISCHMRLWPAIASAPPAMSSGNVKVKPEVS
jgi:hypothetical protein